MTAHALDLPKITQVDRENLLIQLWLRSHGSEGTKEKYEHALKEFLRFTSTTSLLTVSAPVINVFLANLAGKLSVKSVALYRAALSSLFKSLSYNGYRSDNPFAHVKKYVVALEDVHRYLPPEVIQQVIEAATPGRNRAMCKLLFWTGMRVSELINLKLSNFIVGYEVVDILVTGKGNKTRKVRISKAKFNELMEELGLVGDGIIDKNAYLFLSNRQTRISRCQVWRIVSAAGNIVGVHVAPHYFRHSHATTALERGATLKSVQKALGHESIETTAMYQHLINPKAPSDFI